MSEAPPKDRPVQAFFGSALMAVGALMGGLCGLCTAVFVIGGIFGGGGGGEFGGGEMVVMALVIGGLPTLIGVGLFFGGRALWRDAQPPPRPVQPPAHFTDAP
jgi:hypothetical protein